MIYVELSNEPPPGETGNWIRADVVVNGKIMASGYCPERPPYVDGTARKTAESIAKNNFTVKVLGKAPIKKRVGYQEHIVQGPA